MIVDELWARLRNQIASEAVETFRVVLSKELLIGPFDDEKEGYGFAIFIGEWRIGWWKNRAAACDVAERISDAIQQHRIQ